MANLLHPKIKALQQRTAAVSYSNVAVTAAGALESTDLDKGIVKGYIFIWGSRNDRGEIMPKGCCTKSLQERGVGSKATQPIKFLAYHNQSKPLALPAVLQEDETGLYFETNPLDPVSYASDILISLRSGTLNNFSAGFNPIWSKSEYDESTDTIIHKEIALHEWSVVGLASDEKTYQVRSAMLGDTEIDDDINSFVETLPKQYRMQAKGLFARQKSLIGFEPLITLEEEKPVKKRAIDYNYLLQNLKK